MSLMMAKPSEAAGRGVEAAELRHGQAITVLREGDVHVGAEGGGGLHAHHGRPAATVIIVRPLVIVQAALGSEEIESLAQDVAVDVEVEAHADAFEEVVAQGDETALDGHLQVLQAAATHRFTRPQNYAGGMEGGVSNGEEIVVRGYLKPISTLRKPLQSVRFDTREATSASYERSDICVVPAAGVIGEAMVALTIARLAQEKFGGDSAQEMRRNFDGYIEQIRSY